MSFFERFGIRRRKSTDGPNKELIDATVNALTSEGMDTLHAYLMSGKSERLVINAIQLGRIQHVALKYICNECM